MIIDWSADMGADSPWITLPWEGWVDLRTSSAIPPTPGEAQSDPVSLVAEAQMYPELASLLKLANSGHLQTSKVDVFPIQRHEVDPEIAEQGEAATAHGLGSYLDLLVYQPRHAVSFAFCEHTARVTSKKLSTLDLPLSCIEVVIRRARLYHQDTFGWTLYSMGFGPDAASARQAWRQAASHALQALHQELSESLAFPESLPASMKFPTRASSSIG